MNKRINKYTISLIGISVALFLSACSDWLTLPPENDLIEQKFWLKREDVEGSLAAMYDAFRDESIKSFVWGEVRADLVTFGTSYIDYQNIAGADITPSNNAVKWAGYYNTINLANTLMYFSGNVLALDRTFTPRMKEAFDAEALFIRSLSYFYLVRVWKDVPLVLNPTISDTGNLYLPKSSEQVVINQIISDLLKAKDMAYTDEFSDNLPYYKGRANKYSIMALLAQVYLWDQQYQKCVDYCDSIEATGKFGLEPLSTWFNIYSPGNSRTESLFEIQYNDGLESQENPLFNSMIPLSGTAQITLTKNVATFITKEDLRNCENQTPIWKYQGYDLTVKRNGAQRDANFIYLRYADVVLDKAEALCELGRLTEANAKVREIAERAGMSHLDAVVKEDLRKAILDERAREFVLEGKRWFDLLRAAKRNHFEKKQIIIEMILAAATDIQQQAILKTKVYDTMSYYLPIPEDDILYNQNLVQNPFYDR
jgi:hypothetical protein